MSDWRKIIAAAQEQDPDIGDSAMIVEMEWGYWVGGDIYVPKEPEHE
jgi:hypothetical protein